MYARKTRIALGMSGGVDSATSAAYLTSAGFEVLGVTCLFLDGAAAHEAAHDAALVCERIGIEHVTWDSVKNFKSCVTERFVREYAQGLTPSPCVFCNAACKIPSLIAAADAYDCEKVATGHYARIAQREVNGRFIIKTALDISKDQSYMLSQLSQEQLARLLFPLGGTTKAAVRLSAEDLKLPVATKPDSQDICFIDGEHTEYLLQQGIEDNPGDIVDKGGKILGRHEGLFRYTLGQRKGIGVGGAPEPYYVVGKRPKRNELIVGFKDEAVIESVDVSGLNWQAFGTLDGPLECSVKLRYRGDPVACVVEPLDAFHVRVTLRQSQASTAPGQYAVFYEGETVLGGGAISSLC